MTETKICQKCQQSFVIATNDFDFYSKIKVPPPTWCPECRLIRRMVWRNERSLYRRKNDFSGEEIISAFAPEKPYKIYDYKTWNSDQWNPLDYGKEYDFNKSFFEQYSELMQRMPLVALFNQTAVRSDYCQHAAQSKDCYLVSSAYRNENVSYSARIWDCKDSVDIYFAGDIELCYESVNLRNCYRVFYSSQCIGCTDSLFLFDCVNCNNCLGCVNLRNKSYHIFNQPYQKNDYFEEIKKLDLGSFNRTQEFRERFLQFYKKALHKYANIQKSVNVTGDNMSESKNCYQCFDLFGPVENSKFQWWGGKGLNDSYDVGPGTGDGSELIYEGVDNGIQSSRTKFSLIVHNCHNTHYCFSCFSSSHLFACIGLRSKQYCILNKQYTKEEYEELVPKIIEQMNKLPFVDQQGRTYKYGEFFPPELSPFCYNETIAQEYFPLTKEQAISQGFSWKDPEPRNYQIDLKTSDLPDNIKDVEDSIIGKVIECEHWAEKKEKGGCGEQCTEAFKIIESELQFYRRMNLPLPRLCPNCRHYQRIKQRNPLRLWHRKCMCQGSKSEVQSTKSETLPANIYENTSKHFHGDNPCPNEFETSYSPERKEIVYCEECYLREVV